MNNIPGVIIRLQKLPWSAASADIRDFFRGMSIPEGGVHIVGGREGDAFIAFATDEDARQAMRLDGKRLKDSKVKLFLSSRLELQQVVEKTRQELQAQIQQQQPPPQRPPAAVVSAPATGHNDHFRNESSRARRRSRSRSRSPGRSTRSRSPHADRTRARGTRNDHSDPIPFDTEPPMQQGQNFRPPPAANYPPFNANNSTHFAAEKHFGAPAVRHSFLDRSAPPPVAVIDNRFLDRDRPPPLHRSSQGDAYQPQPFAHQQPPPLHRGSPGDAHQPQAFAQQQPAPDQFAGREPLFNRKFDEETNPAGKRDVYAGPPQQQNSNIAAIQAARSSRRALLPPPPEDAGTGEPFEQQQGYADANAPIANAFDVASTQAPFANFQRPPPFLEGNEWEANERRVPQQPPFQFHPAPHGRPTLLAQPESTSVVLNNVPLPMQRYGAVREFFNPIDLDGPDKIKIEVDERGRRTARVFCRFLTSEDAEAAAARTGRDDIFVVRCTEAEFDAALDGGLSRPRPDEREFGSRPFDREQFPRHRDRGYSDGGKDGVYVMEMSNIPYKADYRSLHEILDRFQPLKIRRLYKHHFTSGRVCTSDTAFIIFGNDRDFNAALKMYERTIFDREVRVNRSSVKQMEEAFREAPPEPPEDADPFQKNAPERPRNRPPQHHQPPPAYFEQPQSNRNDSRSSNNRYSPPPRRESPKNAPPSAVFAEEQMPAVNSQFQFTCVCLKGLPMTVVPRDVASFFSGLSLAANGVRLLKSPRNVAYVEFASTSDCERAAKRDRSYVGTQMVSVRACSKEEMMDALQKQFSTGSNSSPPPGAQNFPFLDRQKPFPPQQIAVHSNGDDAVKNVDTDTVNSNGTGRGNLVISEQQETSEKMENSPEKMEETLSSKMPPIDPEVVCTIGVPGCVAVANLPPRITLEEICQLFSGHQLIDDSVRMHYSSTGEPTGDCLLAFATPQDAQAASARLNNTVIDGHTVLMYVV